MSQMVSSLERSIDREASTGYLRPVLPNYCGFKGSFLSLSLGRRETKEEGRLGSGAVSVPATQWTPSVRWAPSPDLQDSWVLKGKWGSLHPRTEHSSSNFTGPGPSSVIRTLGEAEGIQAWRRGTKQVPSPPFTGQNQSAEREGNLSLEQMSFRTQAAPETAVSRHCALADSTLLHVFLCPVLMWHLVCVHMLF